MPTNGRGAQPGGARATMKDVARLAGVGIKTVSRVVNDEPHVSDETREAVERAIVRLRYQRNASAASLRHGQSRSVGLIVEDLAEPFQASLVQAVERALFERGILLFTASSAHDARRERAIIDELIARRVDGLIIIPVPHDHSHLQPELEAGLPVVFADRAPVGVSADLVASDNRGGARVGVAHLLTHGHGRVAYIGEDESVFAGNERLLGYRDALGSAGVAFDRDLVFAGIPSVEHSRAALNRMRELSDPPTALFTGNSLHTLATLRAPEFHEAGLSHVAFDDVSLQDLFRRPLNVVAQDPGRIGSIAAEMLLDRIDGSSSATREIRVDTQLIIRAEAGRPSSATDRPSPATGRPE